MNMPGTDRGEPHASAPENHPSNVPPLNPTGSAQRLSQSEAKQRLAEVTFPAVARDGETAISENGDADDSAVKVVGIGASAGGLDALKEFFSAMPTDSGLAFVVVQHLEPTRESRMAEILAKSTAMRVVQAEDGVAVEPNTVYTNPPGKPLVIRRGRLALGGSTGRGHVEAAIDRFLVSLAEDRGSAAIGIILSGSSGADGPRGVRAIRVAGGMCMAQDPDSAQFPAMPEMVIGTGLVDYVLRPGSMPAPLLEFAGQPTNRPMGRADDPRGVTGNLEYALKLLRTYTGNDYSHYKRSTVFRRIQRRMGLRQIPDLDGYVKLLQKDADERKQLSKDMLIGVSLFFRDSSVFDTLQHEVIEPLVQAKPGDAPLRAWVAGCATGEEAYSIAMLLLEARSAHSRTRPVQVFATDVDEQALEQARAGTFPLSIADDVPPHRLEAFFSKRGQAYQVEKHLREAVVFSRHNLLTDPPFSRLDLISCRNVLIYLEPAAQKKVLSVFSFALNTGGCLLLGKSGGVAKMEDLFEPVSKQGRIFRLVRSNRRAAGDFPLYAAGRPIGALGRDRAVADGDALPQANLDALLRHFDASVVLVDPEGKILYFHGGTERYLGHSKGPASLNILDMTSGTLSATLRRAIRRALLQDEPVHLAQIPLPQERSPLADLTVMRVGDQIGGGRLLAIIFEDARPSSPSPSVRPAAAEEEPLVAQLEAEVKTLRTEVRTNMEAYDAAAEELKSANEEVMSMNEELQSANEELEASKEELQSVNEELTTVNSQLSDNVNELVGTNNDLSNLLMATEIATLFLDTQLRIRRFTPRATELLNVIDSDLGRPVGHITQNFAGVDLATDAAEVLKSLSPKEKEIQTRDGNWYTVRILPYRTVDERIDGTVITFSDVTRLKAAEQGRREFEGHMLHAQKLESLGVLAGGIAHDFNNILTAVLGNMDLALTSMAGDEQSRAYIEEARECVLRASELTAQMLAYSGKGVFELHRVDLNEIVQNMTALAGTLISKKVSLEYALGTSLPLVEADATQLRQVVLNLLVNASEAMAEAGGVIAVATCVRHFDRQELLASFPDSELDPGSYLLLEVRDTGIGMDEATMARVFEPFYSTKFTGRGLGLSAVMGIVKSHHGAISVRSDVGAGSVFSVLLPEAPRLEEAPELPGKADAVTLTGGGTILIVDDLPDVRKIMQAFLKQAGFAVLTACDGAEALSTLAREGSRIRAVLLDVTMPGMKTEDVLTRFHAARPDVPVLLCSGYSESDISARFAGMGVSGFVAKPFTRETLLASVARCLQPLQGQ